MSVVPNPRIPKVQILTLDGERRQKQKLREIDIMMLAIKVFNLIVCVFIFSFVQISAVEASECDFHDISAPIHSILCAVETGRWKVLMDSSAIANAGCLIGRNRCDQVMKVPQEDEVPPSPPPPDARNPTYQQLALQAEAVVPKTWWRAGFADEKLYLSQNNDQLPRKLFDSRVLSNKKLKNIYQCVTRQQFMRKSLDFVENLQANISTTCTAMSTPVAAKFLELWKTYRTTLDGTYTDNKGLKVWSPSSSNEGSFLMAASEVLEHFYTNYGGVWTGCFAYEKSAGCRSLLAGM
ncbi:hypothetical protein EON65_01155 [archaeon]|nr:MAG: hypothetical protein EON65_01155 [archaeon]